MENDRECINMFLQRLNQPFFQLRKEYKSIIADDSLILTQYKKGLVAEKTMIRFLLKSILCPSLRMLMPNILYYIDESSITNRVFRFCCKYPGHFRGTLLNLLSHMWLKQEQLYILTQTINAPEAFCKLFVLHAKKDDSSLNEFISFCRISRDYFNSVDLERLIRENSIELSLSKKQVLDRFIDKAGNNTIS